MLPLVPLAFLLLVQVGPARGDEWRSTVVDQRFMQEVAAAGRAEVEISQLAAKRAIDTDVQEFARHMANDQQTTCKELMQLARRQGVSLPTGMDPKQTALIARLSKLEGPEFDRQYMEAMVDDHREVVARFEHEVESGRDPEVKSFAERTLPTLRHHLELARATADAAGATAGRR